MRYECKKKDRTSACPYFAPGSVEEGTGEEQTKNRLAAEKPGAARESWAARGFFADAQNDTA